MIKFVQKMHLNDEPRPQTEGVHSEGSEWVAVHMSDPDEVPEYVKESNDRLNRALSNKDWNKALNELLNQWLQAAIMHTAATTDLKELNYLKSKVITNGGGEYLMAFLHIDGPKIQLKGDEGGQEQK